MMISNSLASAFVSIPAIGGLHGISGKQLSHLSERANQFREFHPFPYAHRVRVVRPRDLDREGAQCRSFAGQGPLGTANDFAQRIPHWTSRGSKTFFP